MTLTIDTESEPGSWARAIRLTPRLAAPAASSRAPYAPSFTAGMRCPGCGHRGWFVGRASAECACCTFTLPLSPEARRYD